MVKSGDALAQRRDLARWLACGLLPHHRTLCMNQTQDVVYCVCLAGAATHCGCSRSTFFEVHCCIFTRNGFLFSASGLEGFAVRDDLAFDSPWLPCGSLDLPFATRLVVFHLERECFSAKARELSGCRPSVWQQCESCERCLGGTHLRRLLVFRGDHWQRHRGCRRRGG